MVDLLKILYKPKSLLGLITAVGLGFLLIGGLAIPVHAEVSNFFIKWGKTFTLVGIVGWLLFVIPTLVKLWSK